MNLFDKLALSLLVCFGMMVSQIEAALPGAFSKAAEAQADSAGTVSADSEGSAVIDDTAPQVGFGFPLWVEVTACISAIVKGHNRTYLYDAAGYVYDDGKRTYEWTSFGQLEKLEYLAVPELKDFSGNIVHAGGTKVVSEFDFDSGGNRARQIKERVAANDSRKIENTLYLGSYERVNHLSKTDGYASAVLEKAVHRHTLGGGVIYTRTVGGSDPGVRLTNVLADHLGSTDVLLVGKWNSSSSTFVHERTEFQSFDAWGERRSADTQVNYRTSDADPFRTSAEDHERGYTGHEQLDDSGLIHMNGRIYDPELGRFLSPDPYVQIPEYSQNFNRYSYVLNNPLNATDPSGFSFLSKIFHKVKNFIKENWRTIVTIAVGAVLMLSGIGASLFAAWYAGSGVVLTPLAYQIGAGALAGALSGSIVGGLNAALAGGDIGDILRGAAIGGIQGGISGGVLHGMELNATSFADKAAHVAGHGVLGGAANEAMGGKFQDGFLSAAAGAAAGWMGAYKAFSGKGYGNVAARTTVAGVVGGTASVLGGGKFANGAYTAAFQHLFNAELENHLQNKSLRKIASEATSMVREATAADDESAEFAIRIGVNEKGQYALGTIVRGTAARITGQEILSSKLPKGYRWIGVTHSHPFAELGNLSVYSKGGVNTRNIPTYFSESDVLFSHEHQVFIGVSLPKGGVEYGYVNGSYKTWILANSNSNRYRDEKSFVFDNYINIK